MSSEIPTVFIAESVAEKTIMPPWLLGAGAHAMGGFGGCAGEHSFLVMTINSHDVMTIVESRRFCHDYYCHDYYPGCHVNFVMTTGCLS